MRAPIRLGLGLLFVASIAQAADEGLSPSKVFELASPSIVVIEAHDKAGAVIALGSGVAISEGVVVVVEARTPRRGKSLIHSTGRAKFSCCPSFI